MIEFMLISHECEGQLRALHDVPLTRAVSESEAVSNIPCT